MREFCTDGFNAAMRSRFRSWRFLRRDFAPAFRAMEAAPGGVTEGGSFPSIWGTCSKFVLLLTAADGTRAVYKSFRAGSAVFRTRFRFAPSTREAVNYMLAASLGIPTPEVLGVGETRRRGRLTGAFLITRYVEGSVDGRVFTPDGERAGDTAARDDFTREQLRLLARLHDAGYRHKGFHPGNLLTGGSAGPRALWIDVADCRSFGWGRKLRQTARDLTEYFRCFDFDAEARREFLRGYLAARRHDPPPESALVAAVESELRRRRFRQLPPPVKIPPAEAGGGAPR